MMLSTFGTRFTYIGAIEPTTQLPGLVIRDYERGVELPMGLLTDSLEEMAERIITACIMLSEDVEVRLNCDAVDVELDAMIEGEDAVRFYGTEIGNLPTVTPELPVHVAAIEET